MSSNSAEPCGQLTVAQAPQNFKRTLEACSQKQGGVLFLKCTGAFNERRLAEHLSTELPKLAVYDCAGEVALEWIDLEQRLVRAASPGIVLLVVGFTTWLAMAGGRNLGALNLRREGFFRSLQAPVIIVGAPQSMAQVAERAPDFWSWREGVFDFVYDDMLVKLGEFDTPEFKPECPACGAEEGQACSEPDPVHEGLGVELGDKVHVGRLA